MRSRPIHPVTGNRMPLGWSWKCSVATEPEQPRRLGCSMTWDAASRTPLSPISPAGILDAHGFAHGTGRHRSKQGGTAAGGEAATVPVDGLICGHVSMQRNVAQMTHNPEGKPSCRAAFAACPRRGGHRGQASPSSRAGAVAARCERRRSHWPCHPRAINSGHERYPTDNHGHSKQAVRLGAGP